MKAYHITLNKNYSKIKENGLIPKIGERSKELGEENPAIYLFKTKELALESLDNWLGNWFMDKYEDEVEIIILEVNISGLDLVNESNSFELIIKEEISPDRIEIVDKIII